MCYYLSDTKTIFDEVHDAAISSRQNTFKTVERMLGSGGEFYFVKDEANREEFALAKEHCS